MNLLYDVSSIYVIYLGVHFSRSPTSYYNAFCGAKEIRGYASVTTRGGGELWRFVFVFVSSWRRFGYSLMMTAAAVARKKRKKCNKEKNLHTMTTSVVSWWVSNGKANVYKQVVRAAVSNESTAFYAPRGTSRYYCLTREYSTCQNSVFDKLSRSESRFFL